MIWLDVRAHIFPSLQASYHATRSWLKATFTVVKESSNKHSTRWFLLWDLDIPDFPNSARNIDSARFLNIFYAVTAGLALSSKVPIENLTLPLNDSLGIWNNLIRASNVFWSDFARKIFQDWFISILRVFVFSICRPELFHQRCQSKTSLLSIKSHLKTINLWS